MTDPFSPVSYRELSWPDLPIESADNRKRLLDHLEDETYGVCRMPSSVIGGALCGDATAISNACRRAAPGTVDAFLCDDKELEKLQNLALDLAKKASWRIVELLFGAKVVKP
jgi:hypothetical protein